MLAWSKAPLWKQLGHFFNIPFKSYERANETIVFFTIPYFLRLIFGTFVELVYHALLFIAWISFIQCSIQVSLDLNLGLCLHNHCYSAELGAIPQKELCKFIFVILGPPALSRFTSLIRRNRPLIIEWTSCCLEVKPTLVHESIQHGLSSLYQCHFKEWDDVMLPKISDWTCKLLVLHLKDVQ